MNYRMNNASVIIPDNWHEQTLHIFSSETPTKPGVSLVINKELISEDKGLDLYKELALTRLPDELKDYKLIKERKVITTQHLISAYVFEFTWQSEHGQIHHYQAIFLNPFKPSDVYNITISVLEFLNSIDVNQTFENIVDSFRFE